MQNLQSQLLEELLNLAYQEVGDVPLTQEQESNLINSCIDQVELVSYPSANLPTNTVERYGK